MLKMSRTSKAALFLSLVLSALLFAGAGAAADRTFTVQGRITYPDGRPAAGLELRLYPWSPEGLDRSNIYWRIPNFDPHFVTTDADGRYVMTGIIDYPENKSHWYSLYTTEKTAKVWHGTARFMLREERPVTVVDIQLEPATWVTVKLKDKDGKPFNGPRLIWVQVGTDISDPSKGYTKFEELTFVNGEAGMRVVIRDKNSPVARVAVLDVTTRDEARKAMQTKGLRLGTGSNADGVKLAHRDARGRPLDRQLNLPPVSETTVEFTL